MRKAPLVLLLLAALSLNVGLTGCASGKIENFTWRKLSTEHFTLISNAPRAESVELARAVERFRALVLNISGATLTPETIPTKIYLFTDWGSYFKYTAGTSIVGFNYPTLRANYIVISPGVLDSDPKRTIFHEYVHYLLRHQRSSFPAWYDEGFAQFMSDVTIRDGHVLVGNLPREKVEAYVWKWKLPLKQVMTNDYVLDWAPENVQAFYAESWATVNYLLSGAALNDPARTKQLATYLQLLNSGVGRDAAFATAFQTEYATMTRQVKSFIERRRLPGVDVAESSLSYKRWVREEVLETHQVASDLGELTLLLGEHKAALAQSLFERTLQVDPKNSAARSGLAMALAEQTQFERAIAEARQAVDEDPTRAAAHLDFAKILFGVCGADTSAAPSPGCVEMLQVARDQFERSLELAPATPEGRAGIGMTLSRLQENPSRAIVSLNSVYDLSQWMPQLNLELAKLYARAGKADLARQSLTQVVRWTKSNILRQQAETMLAQMSGQASATFAD